jgi:hypothetical protein
MPFWTFFLMKRNCEFIEKVLKITRIRVREKKIN